MREILFRGKTLGSNMWIYGDLRQYPSGAKSIKSAELIHTVEVDPATIGQYTGLKDRDGHRIFEGDIVRYYSTYREEFTGDNCVVEYGVFNCSCCDGVYGWEFKGGDIRDFDDYAVIGNIHDNPELLKDVSV